MKMADKTVILIDPDGEKTSFDCPLKLMEFLESVYFNLYIDHGVLPYEWKWETNKWKSEANLWKWETKRRKENG